ncbi:hypothetical protein HYDPIDRAFT_29670 [Hydnomerulius pinastri MD-312]|uniref:Protein kinase domain-containing protein n=1 Tax=Hydnomerulius pinastri MD-312 TaxID=994086 RepID=A0A0C9WEK6_9AGAM|nr:hypothetical protein HYDPIDRAFT_29670 [Hydnomerulius pinastri MD-312]
MSIFSAWYHSLFTWFYWILFGPPTLPLATKEIENLRRVEDDQPPEANTDVQAGLPTQRKSQPRGRDVSLDHHAEELNTSHDTREEHNSQGGRDSLSAELVDGKAIPIEKTRFVAQNHTKQYDFRSINPFVFDMPSHRSPLSFTSLDLTSHVFRQSMYPTAYGGWSDIWKCILKQDSQSFEVAVKSIRSYIIDDTDMRKKSKKLRRELKVWAQLSHKNVLPLLGVATGFGPFTAFVCPWMPNGTLTTYLERNADQLSLRDRLELLRGAASGLSYLHSCSVIHGDLTGSNILISATGEVQLSDFGLSSVVMEFTGTSYFSSSLNGTPRWAAPEIFMMLDGQTSVWVPSDRSDIYSFGSVILHVLSGHVPMPDDSARAKGTAERESSLRMETLWQSYYGLTTKPLQNGVQRQDRSHTPRSPSNGNAGDDAVYHHIAQFKADASPILQQIEFPLKHNSDDLSGQLRDKGSYPTRFGGYGDIWKCTWVKGQEHIPVAVKSIRLEVGDSEDRVYKTRKLYKEASIWKSAKHKNVLQFLGLTLGFGPLPSLVSPWASNGTLTSYLKCQNDTLSLHKRFGILSSVVSGLQYLHSLKIIHGDLTGSNILVDKGDIYLSDFGLSRVLVDIVGSEVYSSSKAGAVRWAAPELFEPQMYEEDSEKERMTLPNVRTDMYSFGSVMLQVLSSKIPYYQIKSDTQVLVMLIKGVKPRRPEPSYITNGSWGFIQQCWSPIEGGGSRPTVEDAIIYVDGCL